MQALCKLVRATASVLFLSLSLAAWGSGITAVPPAAYVPSPIEKANGPARPIVSQPARTIVLPAASAAELAKLKAVNTVNAKNADTKRSLAIGVARDLPQRDREIRGSALTWTPVADGGVAARIDVTSPGAKGIRVALSLQATDPDVTVRVSGPGSDAPVFGPYPANRIAELARTEGAYWTPVIEGDTASIEIHAPADVPVDSIALTIVRVSHLALAGEALRKIDAKILDIGTAGSCEVDVACVADPTPALFNTAKSVAKMLYTDPDGTTYTCTGTLINDSLASMTAYFFTANHCINSQARASTLNTYWFFDAVACNSKAVPPYALLTGGATLLGRSEDYDWSLLRLRDAPPAGAMFSAWRAESLATGVTAYTMHHPEGDLTKWSQGVTQGYHTYNDGSTFMQMKWNLGSTEPGSSGAGLFTLQANGGYYELRGGLFGGAASCTNRAGIDVFSRLDNAAPMLRQYLTPNVPNPNGEVIVVEFYNAMLDHYFMTSNPAEIADLDAGVHPGWVRTGLRFLAYGNPALAPPGATPVCRFYLLPAVGDSHFYSGDPSECAATAAKFGNAWTEESPAVFWIVLPDKTTGACPTGLRAVYRFFHTAATNHRYTA
ncbi:MAG TPA: trypsin-like peptidase domain-containing protein, partial [Casimicrobiaceae bacterium]|nr:trypsin-like peptidase domain-containing protein [Casimicrobiaceae bacterium]